MFTLDNRLQIKPAVSASFKLSILDGFSCYEQACKLRGISRTSEITVILLVYFSNYRVPELTESENGTEINKKIIREARKIKIYIVRNQHPPLIEFVKDSFSHRLNTKYS